MAAAGSALAEVFLAHLPAPARGAEIDRAALERGLDELCARGSDAWPAVPQARERFVGHVAERLSGDAAEPDPVAALARLHAGDLWLASACAAGDRAALAAFDRQFLGDLARYLARRSPASLLEDLQQQLRTRLLVADEGKPPRIAGYTGRGPLGAWLRVAAARLAINMQQARATRTLEPAIPPTPDEGEPDPELAYMRGRYGPALRAAVSGANRGARFDARRRCCACSSCTP